MATRKIKHFSFDLMIQLKNVGLVRHSVTLFDNFTWSIGADDCWVMNGRNGSGKTVLLQLIAGDIHPSSGKIIYDFVDGVTWDEKHQQRRQNITFIGCHALHEFTQGHNDLYYQQRYYSIGDQQEPTVGEVLGESVDTLQDLELPQRFSIVDLLQLPVTRLSNGQLKKLLLIKNFARGIPKLMLLDYPFEGLDHASRADLCAFIDFLHDRYGVQVIIADHHHHLPKCINRRLTLDNFRVVDSQPFVAQAFNSEVPITSVTEPSKGEPVVSLKDLCIKYGEKVIIHNLNWTVYKGDRWALVGRNGSGKTTLFSILFADHPQAYAHDIRLFGRRRGSGESIWDIKRRINYLGPEQMSYLNPGSFLKTGLQFLQEQQQNFDHSSLDYMISFFEARSILNRQIRMLSSGELQLLMIVKCFLSDKELWLLDEPFQFLDNHKKEKVSDYLASHLRKDLTVIMITHYDHDRLRWTDKWMQL